MAKPKKRKKKREQKRAKRVSKEMKLNRQVIFFLAILGLILISFFAFTYLFKNTGIFGKPCFDYEGFQVCKVALEGTNIIFYSIPVDFTVAGIKQQHNVVLRNDPRKIDKLGINVDVPITFFVTRPQVLWATMNPQLQSKAVAAAYEITKFAGNLNIQTAMAFTESIGDSNETNIIRCEDASNAYRVVWMKYINITAEETKASSVSASQENPSCIIIESTSYDGLIEAADAMVIAWLLRIT